jgi:arylsulfatase A-like enzyme/Tfp pilus assembly protein PilF
MHSCAHLLKVVIVCLSIIPATATAQSRAPKSDEHSLPNIVLITIDTARADRMGFLGSHSGLTPNVDALARHSIVFSRAYAHVPLTTPSHATILTGTYPQFNHLGDLGTALARDLPYLPDVLHQHGYRTAAFVGSQVLDPKSAAAPGFDRGFDVYDAGFHSRREGESRYSSEERRAEVVVDHALAWLKQAGNRPFFLWVHVYDPHDPYDPPEPFKSKFAGTPYDGEIAYVDSALGKLFAGLSAAGIFGPSVLAIAADHGEAFGEHGEQSHGFFLYDETVHVPLLMKLPGTGLAKRIDQRVGLVDVAPTLLKAAGIEVPPAMQGTNLLTLAKGRTEARSERPVYSETDYAQRAFGWSWLRALRAGNYLYVDAPGRELYDESADPAALHNVARQYPAIADTLQSELDTFRQQTSRGPSDTHSTLSAETAEELQALGYITSASSSTSAKGNVRGADPKDKIQTANALHSALMALDQERYGDAVPELQGVLKNEPDLPLANLQLGIALNGLQNYHAAIPFLQKAVALNPESGRAHFELGVALGETGNWESAAPQLQAAVAHAPDSDDLHYYLAMAFDKLGRLDEAEKSFQAALAINPSNYRAHLFLGRLLGMQNRPEEALPHLQKAVSLQPESPDAHKFLANVYIQLGQMQNARREQSEAERHSR